MNKLRVKFILACLPFIGIHALGFATPFLFRPTVGLVALCLISYVIRMFWVTAGYHRYFSHRSFKTSRWFQFCLAFFAQTSAQKGALWWSTHHRDHHRYSDQPQDVHSPVQRGFWWSHVGWIFDQSNNPTKWDNLKEKEWKDYPELVWLNRWHLVPPALYGAVLLACGGAAALFWGLFLSTVLLWHGSFTVNSLSHQFGSRRYATTDDSRNNILLALITCGEGWHNNHHHYQASARQGFFWWEIDATFLVLKLLSKFGIVWRLLEPSEEVKASNLAVTEKHPQLKIKRRKAL